MSASTLTTAAFNNTTDANFRTWVAAIIATILAGGWTQTGDTGQINTGTVLAPVAINTAQGYAMFSSNDAGGALNNFFVKVEFGSGGAATRPGLWITIGWATDGAGNLVSATFPVGTRQQISTAINPSGSAINVNMAAGVNYIVISAMTLVATGEAFIASIERTRDTALAFQNQVLMFTSSTSGALGGGTGNSQVIDRANAYPVVSNAALINCYVIPANANSPIAAKAGLGLLFGFAPGSTSPSMNLFGVEQLAIGSAQETIIIPIQAVNHSYKIQANASFTFQVGCALLARFE